MSIRKVQKTAKTRLFESDTEYLLAELDDDFTEYIAPAQVFHATAAANDVNRSPGSGLCSRQVIAIGSSDSCLT